MFELCLAAPSYRQLYWLFKQQFMLIYVSLHCCPRFTIRWCAFTNKIWFFISFFFSHLQAVKEFTEIINRNFERKNISPATALKFLLARKFDVQRAVALFEQHELIRQQEGLYTLDPMIDPLRSELETGKFTILVSVFFFGKYLSICTGIGNQLTIPWSHQNCDFNDKEVGQMLCAWCPIFDLKKKPHIILAKNTGTMRIISKISGREPTQLNLPKCNLQLQQSEYGSVVQ